MNTTDLFFNIIKYYATNDDSLLSDKIRSIANEQLDIASQFFAKFVQLPAFTGYDSDNLFDFVLHWYAAARTIITLHKNISDPYTLDDESINEYIKSMGFIYPEYIPANNKPTFLLELANLYKIKGSPQALIKLLHFLNYTDVRLLEFWLVADESVDSLTYDIDFNYDDPILPKQLLFVGKQVERMLTDHPLEIRYTYEQFKEKFKDAHWFLNEQQIQHLNADLKLSLPSLTPFFGLFNCQYLTKWFETYAIISRLIKQEYQQYIDSGTVYRIHLLRPFGKISLLECVLALWWAFYVQFEFIDPVTNELDTEKFATLVPDEQKAHLCYVVDIANQLDKDTFVDDFNSVFRSKPKTRSELRAKIQEYKDKFLHKWNYSILPNPQDIRTLLETLNPDLFNWLYNQHTDNLKHTINELWSVLDFITGSLDLALSTFSNTFVFEGTDIYTVINFFKPIYARLINVAYLIEISTTFDHVVIDDNVHMTIYQYAMTQFERHRDFIYDSTDTFDALQYLIFTDVHEHIEQTINEYVSAEYDKYDENGKFDTRHTIITMMSIRPYLYVNTHVLLNDEFYALIKQYIPDGLATDFVNFDESGYFDHNRALSINDIVQTKLTTVLNDSGFIALNGVDFDKNGIFDNPKTTIYYDTLLTDIRVIAPLLSTILDKCHNHITNAMLSGLGDDAEHVDFDKGGVFDSMRHSYIYDGLEISFT